VTAIEIINEIEHLAPEERERIASYLRSAAEPRTLAGGELADLAGMLPGLTNPAEVQALKQQIAAGFYGSHA